MPALLTHFSPIPGGVDPTVREVPAVVTTPRPRGAEAALGSGLVALSQAGSPADKGAGRPPPTLGEERSRRTAQLAGEVTSFGCHRPAAAPASRARSRGRCTVRPRQCL